MIKITVIDVINSLKEKVMECENYTKESIEVKHNKDYVTIWLCKIAVLKIKEKKDEIRIEITNKYLKHFDLCEDVRFINSDPEWGKTLLNNNVLEKLMKNISDVYKQCYLDEPVESFGCCSRYIECSNNKTCIHPDLKFSRGCKYKTNLEKGKIFYGKNLNV